MTANPDAPVEQLQPGPYVDSDRRLWRVGDDGTSWLGGLRYRTSEAVLSGPLTRLVPLPTREALAETIHKATYVFESWEKLSEHRKRTYLDVADAVLALLTGQQGSGEAEVRSSSCACGSDPGEDIRCPGPDGRPLCDPGPLETSGNWDMTR